MLKTFDGKPAQKNEYSNVVTVVKKCYIIITDLAISLVFTTLGKFDFIHQTGGLHELVTRLSINTMNTGIR